jgi:GMP synthase (glutamine-hydrolysing)
MMKAVAIRHVAFEDLGILEDLLRERGIEVEYRDAAIDELGDAAPGEAELLVVLGGPVGAYEEAQYPFLLDELRLVEGRIAAGRPLLGICLGAQIIARALGARVYPGAGKEIGWGPLALTEAGAASPLAHLAPPLAHVLHWHGDTFDLPAGACRLASTALYENQAYALEAVLGLQFHPEVIAARFERWLVGHAHEVAATPGVTVEELRRGAAEHGSPLERQGRRFFAAWLDQVLNRR